MTYNHIYENQSMLIPKSDQEFFEFYCKAANVTFNNGENEVIFIKNAILEFSYLSPSYLKNLDPNGIIKLDQDNRILTSSDDFHLQRAIKQDLEIKETLTAQDFIYIDIYNRVGLIHKRPIINPATNNFVGIIGTVRPFYMPNILSLIYKIHDVTIGMLNSSKAQPPKYQITDRQQMVLFLYLNKFSNTEIATIISLVSEKISKNRVNDHLQNLKYIFNVTTKEQLIEKAISLNYHRLIPRGFLKPGSYPITDEAMIVG